MALQVWLPLNGNLNNQGLSNTVITNNGATVDNSGKIGKCYSFNGADNYINLSDTPSTLFPADGCSYSFSSWIYCANAPSVQTAIVSSNNYRTMGFGLGFRPSRKFVGMIMNSGSSQEYEFSYVLPLNEWHHITLTFDSSTKKQYFYVDGSFIESSSTINFIWLRGTLNFWLGRNHQGGWAGWFNGKLNDVRIYDHCLSAKEVSEIAKGLILHYPLNNDGFGAPNLLPKSCIVNRGCTSFSYDSVNNLWNSVAPAGSSVWGYGVTFSNSTKISIPKGTTICFSLEVKPDIDCSCNADVNNATIDGSNPSGNDNDDTPKRTTSGYNLKANIWNKVYWTYTAKNYDLYDANSNWGIQTTNLSSPVTFQIRNIKVEYGNKPTPWIPHSSDVIYSTMGLNDMTEFDCSGYGNDGTKNRTLSYSSNSARYSGCYNFTGSDRIMTPNIAFENMDSSTMSFWIKFNNEFKNWTHYVFFANGFNWTGNGHDFIIVANSGNLSTSVTSTNISLDCCSYVSNFTANLNTWYHIVITWDKLNYTIKKYVNGELKATNNDSTNKRLDTYKASHNYHCIGNEGSNATYAGNFDISDFRIYSTVLSDNAVKQLYNISISVDKSGNFYAYEFREV